MLHSNLDTSQSLGASPQIPLNKPSRRRARAQDDERNQQSEHPHDRSQDDDDLDALVHAFDVHEQRDGDHFEDEGGDDEGVLRLC